MPRARTRWPRPRAAARATTPDPLLRRRSTTDCCFPWAPPDSCRLSFQSAGDSAGASGLPLAEPGAEHTVLDLAGRRARHLRFGDERNRAWALVARNLVATPVEHVA